MKKLILLLSLIFILSSCTDSQQILSSTNTTIWSWSVEQDKLVSWITWTGITSSERMCSFLSWSIDVSQYWNLWTVIRSQEKGNFTILTQKWTFDELRLGSVFSGSIFLHRYENNTKVETLEKKVMWDIEKYSQEISNTYWSRTAWYLAWKYFYILDGDDSWRYHKLTLGDTVYDGYLSVFPSTNLIDSYYDREEAGIILRKKTGQDQILFSPNNLSKVYTRILASLITPDGDTMFIAWKWKTTAWSGWEGATEDEALEFEGDYYLVVNGQETLLTDIGDFSNNKSYESTQFFMCENEMVLWYNDKNGNSTLKVGEKVFKDVLNFYGFEKDTCNPIYNTIDPNYVFDGDYDNQEKIYFLWEKEILRAKWSVKEISIIDGNIYYEKYSKWKGIYEPYKNNIPYVWDFPKIEKSINEPQKSIKISEKTTLSVEEIKNNRDYYTRDWDDFYLYENEIQIWKYFGNDNIVFQWYLQDTDSYTFVLQDSDAQDIVFLDCKK